MNILFFLTVLILTGCGGGINLTPTSGQGQADGFQGKTQSEQGEFATPDEVRLFSREVSSVYLIGPGDVLNLTVWNRPEISDPKIVAGANGKINVVRIGFVDVVGRTIHEIQQEITERLKQFYERPEVTLRIMEQKNNRAFVLGRVANPGEIQLPADANLLEVLALAGGLPILDDRKAPLTECIITRAGKRLRIDLRELLDKGVIAFNAKIQNKDVIYIPESGESEHVYLLGEVAKSGVVRLTSGMTFFDAIMMNGGPTNDASLEKTFLIRMKGKGSIKQISLKKMLENADMGQNFILQNSDVVFVTRSGLSKFKEFFGYIYGAMTGVDLGMSISEKLGLMQKLRQIWWQQGGFVNTN